MGDPNADSDNPVLKEEQDAQVCVSCLCSVVEHIKCLDNLQLVVPCHSCNRLTSVLFCRLVKDHEVM